MAGRASKRVIGCSDRPSSCPPGVVSVGAQGEQNVFWGCCPHPGCVGEDLCLCSWFVCIHEGAGTHRPERVPGGSALCLPSCHQTLSCYTYPHLEIQVLDQGSLSWGSHFPFKLPFLGRKVPKQLFSGKQGGKRC